MFETASKIIPINEIYYKVAGWKFKNKKIVFTNGCFDILHLGHIDYLEKAKKLGDVLIIGVNSDASIQRIKGNSRPIQDEIARSRILAALSFVDAVIIFDTDTPLPLIETILPDILVKGNDYKVEEIVGYLAVTNNGGSVETITLVDGYSTSAIINKIKTT